MFVSFKRGQIWVSVPLSNRFFSMVRVFSSDFTVKKHMQFSKMFVYDRRVDIVMNNLIFIVYYCIKLVAGVFIKKIQNLSINVLRLTECYM